MAKTYAEYVKESKNRPPSPHLMPPTALPKRSKGDTHRHRAIKSDNTRRGLIDVREIPMTKDGLIDTRKIKAFRSKMYKIQEAGHGR